MQEKDYKLLVFDWDGTLINSEDLTIESTQKLASDIGYPVPKPSDIRKHFGLLLEDMLYQLFPEEDKKKLTKIFYNYFSEKKLATNFFEDAIETLVYLKDQGFDLAIATNRTRKKLDESLQIAKIKDLFKTTKCPEDGPPKPNPFLLLTILKELKKEPEETLMIGDTIFDMQFAKNADVDALAACYGHHDKTQLAAFKPVGFINKITDVKSFLNL